MDEKLNPQVIQSLDELLSRNVIGSKQLRNRCNGFVAELEFQSLLRTRNRARKIFCGGFLLCDSRGKSVSDRPFYFTTVSDCADINSYRSVYRLVAKLSCSGLFLIVFDSKTPFDRWQQKTILGPNGPHLRIPELQVYQYDVDIGDFKLQLGGLTTLTSQFHARSLLPARKVSIRESEKLFRRMAVSEHRDLIDLYVSRLIFDGHLGVNVERGIPTDIDFLAEDKNGKIHLIEVKEKDLSKRPPSGFGMDVRRIQELELLEKKTGCPVFYVVRQINNQVDRELVAWRIISLQEFIKHTRSSNPIEGGTGMRSLTSSNPTLICPYQHFNRFS